MSNTLTWFVLEVEDGYDVISEIKHRKHSHFGESLGQIAQIKNRHNIHVASLTTSESLFLFLFLFYYYYYYSNCAVWIGSPPNPVHRRSTKPPGLDSESL